MHMPPDKLDGTHKPPKRVNIEKILSFEDEEELELTPEETLVYHLVRAQQHAQQALDTLYKRSGPKRSLWYRMVLGRAQSILMSLSVRELGKKFGEKGD